MRSQGIRCLRDSSGKGRLGCFLSLVLFGIAVFVGIKLIPIYYTNYELESGVRSKVSFAGANNQADEDLIKSVVEVFSLHGIDISPQYEEGKEDYNTVRLLHPAKMVGVEVHYVAPVDFIIFKQDFKFKIEETSIIGRL